MECHVAKDRMNEGRETAALRRHLAACADCAAYRREVGEGGREIAEAFLSVAPSPEFEGRVAAALSETEIGVRPRPRSRVAVTAAFLALLLAVPAAWLLPRGSRGPASERSDGTREHAERPAIVTTEPYRENPLFLHLGRIGTSGRTTLLLSFAGDSSRVELEPVARVEDELLRAWAKGARRAEVTIGPEVTGREVGLLLGELERTDYGWDMVRPRN